MPRLETAVVFAEGDRVIVDVEATVTAFRKRVEDYKKTIEELRENDLLRRYCWRTGLIITCKGVCPECGQAHRPIEDQEICAAFAQCKNHGHPCDLYRGHDGPHSTKRCTSE